MSDFFEPPPKPAVSEPRYRTPPWFGAPGGTLPGIVAFERVLARTDKVAVCVSRIAAFPTGFEFDVLTMTADEHDEIDPMRFHHRHHLHTRSGREHPA